MPFFDNTGIDLEDRRGPIWAAFASLLDQLERFVVLNLAWSLQLVPILAAVMLPTWPPPVRLLLALYSGVALALMTGLLYALVHVAVWGEPLDLALAQEMLRSHGVLALRALAPLYGSFGVLVGVAAVATLNGGHEAGTALYVLNVLARLFLLLALLCSTYWGPIWAENPKQSMWLVARRSLALAWHYPVKTLLATGAVALALVLGAVSIGGIFLAVPVLIALFQTHTYLNVTRGRGNVPLQ